MLVLQSGFPPCFLKDFQNLEDLNWAVAAAQGNCWDVRLDASCFCCPLFHLDCLLAFCGGRSYFQHCSSVPVHFWLLCAILQHNPIGVWCTLVYHCCWFPCSILPVLDANWCTWGQFNVVSFWFVPLPLDEFLVGLVHFWGT